MKKLINYLKESRQELSKVVWPNRQATFRMSLAVIVISLIAALYMGIVDFGLLRLLQFIIK